MILDLWALPNPITVAGYPVVLRSLDCLDKQPMCMWDMESLLHTDIHINLISKDFCSIFAIAHC